jgi:hypothetical protein
MIPSPENKLYHGISWRRNEPNRSKRKAAMLVLPRFMEFL